MRKLENHELNRKDVEGFKNAAKLPIIVVLDQVRSLNNIGSIFRSSDAFLVSEIFLCGITATPPNKEIHKTALGATETVNWSYFGTTLEAVAELKKRNATIFAVEQTEQAAFLHQVNPNPKELTALIFGNEVFGVEQEVINACDGVIEIPQLGSKHSLNISVSAGIVLWEFARKLNAFSN
ncbi:RNA methyltransferase [Flavobacterium sp.]|uniref:RNA methyltransferase n=1 Tax=Flavobacterium sp. TaxID=239 RepID=UPI00261090FF|nr:RNA methyltransferase [Flavobacterium sp.]